MKYAEVGDVVPFGFTSNNTSGSGADGASFTAHVREMGASASAAPVLNPTPYLLTDPAYPDGSMEVAVDTTGFTASKYYGVYSTLAVDLQNPTGFVGELYLGKANEAFGRDYVRTTIANLTSPTVFTLTNGPSVDNALRNKLVMITSAADPTLKAPGFSNAYTGFSKEIVLETDPGIFTIAENDIVEVIEIGANIKAINDVPLIGNGSTTPFGV